MEKEQKEQKDEDVEFEDIDESTSPQLTIKRLREKLKLCETERQNYLNNWQKDKADFINARKRDGEEREQTIKFATENLISQVLPVVDNLSLAIKNSHRWDNLPKEWLAGVESVLTQLIKILNENGVQVISPLGDKFDPRYHEAVETVEINKKEDDHVIVGVHQEGFMIDKKVIRPAKVKVGEYHE